MKKFVFLTMLFGLMLIAVDRASAQNVCSKNLDGKQVYVEVANITNKAFTVNLVDEDCKESPSNQQIPSYEIFSQIMTNGQAFRVREVGTNKLLHQFAVNPSKPLIFIETEVDGSNLRVRDFDVVGDDFKKRADAALASVKSESKDTFDQGLCSKALSKKAVNIKWVNKTNASLMVVPVTLDDCVVDFLNSATVIKSGKTYSATSYPGYVYQIYYLQESQESPGDYSKIPFKTITVSASNASRILSGSPFDQ